MLDQPSQLLLECHAEFYEHGGFTLSPLGLPPLVQVHDPDLVREICQGDPDRFQAGAGNAWFLEPILGPSSPMVLDGARHAELRRLMEKLFTPSAFAGYGRAIEDLVDRAMERWSPGDRISIHREMERITVQVILQVLLGVRPSERAARFSRGLLELLALGSEPSRAFREFDGKKKALDLELRELIDQELGRADDGHDALSILARATSRDGSVDHSTVRDLMMTFLVPGHDTTATTLAWAVHYIWSRTELRLGLLAEQRGESGAGGRLLEAVVDETLRLHPIISALNRRLSEPTGLGRWRLPADVVVCPAIFLLHRDRNLWPEPTRFDPGRFLDRDHKPSPFSFLPFGAGPRHCVGAGFARLEMTIVLSRLLRRVDLELESVDCPKTVRRGITHAPAGGVAARVRGRRLAEAS